MERKDHSTIKIGDYLYMWGGDQPDLPREHDSEEKRALFSVMEVCHFTSCGPRWEQKPTTGTPPLGVSGYAAAAIRNEIFYYGGYCGHGDCMHNSLFSFNVDTFNWKELSPTTFHRHGPRKKQLCGMVAVQLDGEYYLVVIGGSGPPEQRYASYNASVDKYDEIHYYKLSSGECVCINVDLLFLGEWIIPTVTGDRPPPIQYFTLTSVTNNTAVLFGGDCDTFYYAKSNDVYIINFTMTSVVSVLII